MGLPEITSVEQTLQEFCLRATVAFGVWWCKYTNCGVWGGVQKDSAGTKSNGIVPNRSRTSSAYFKTMELVNRKYAPPPPVFTDHSANGCFLSL